MLLVFPDWLYSFSRLSSPSLLKFLIYLVMILNFSLFFSSNCNSATPFLLSTPFLISATALPPISLSYSWPVLLFCVLPASPRLFISVFDVSFQWDLFLDHAPPFLDSALAIYPFSPHTISPSSASTWFLLSCHVSFLLDSKRGSSEITNTASLLIVAAETWGFRGDQPISRETMFGSWGDATSAAAQRA